MSIGAIVVTYQTPVDLLRRCLVSLKQNGIDDLRIVANDADNIGFAAAVNRGAGGLTNDFLLFLNPDAELLPNSLHLPLRYLSDHPRVGILGPLLFNREYTCEKNCFGEPVNPWSLFSRHLARRRLPAVPQAVGWVSGGSMFVRRSVFLELSGFDPQFFMYWEDIDLCRRAQANGWQVHLLPAWKVLHQRGRSSSDEVVKTRLYDNSADKYWRKHYSKPIWLSQRYLRFIYRSLSPLAD
jgi:hypothetical protein